MPDNYRFTIQWGADSAVKIHAGEALKSLGNRKSRLIVEAVSAYIKANPESLSQGYKFRAAVEPVLTQNQVEAIVRNMIDARLANSAPIVHSPGDTGNPDAPRKDDLDFMIQNLDVFA